MPAPSGQIPPPWAWWGNEAPTTRAACCPLRLTSLGRGGAARSLTRRPPPGYRSDRKAARSSAENSWGCSQAAKWPPLSASLK